MEIKTLVAALQDVPVLAQGVLASAIFWLVHAAGKKVAFHSSSRVRAHLLGREMVRIRNEILRASAKISEGQSAAGDYAAILWYRASRELVNALIWLTLGLLLNTLTEVFGVIGFIVSLYYLFAARNVVKSYEDEELEVTKARIAKLRKEYAETEKLQKALFEATNVKKHVTK